MQCHQNKKLFMKTVKHKRGKKEVMWKLITDCNLFCELLKIANYLLYLCVKEDLGTFRFASSLEKDTARQINR